MLGFNGKAICASEKLRTVDNNLYSVVGDVRASQRF